MTETTETIICTDARPEHQYGAIMAAGGHQELGWIPARTVTTDEVNDLIEETNAEIVGEISWNEFGQLVLVSA